MKTVSLIARNLINIIYPLHCLSCKKILDPVSGLVVCAFCLGSIKTNPRPYCRSCGRTVSLSGQICGECRRMNFSFESAHAAYLYEGVMKELIHLFKFKHKIQLAPLIASLFTDFIAKDPEIMNAVDAVTYVPLRAESLRDREFNQSKILARAAADKFGLPLLDALEKTRPTRSQNSLPREKRLINLDGAFRVRPDISLDGLKMLLVDDVMTTGVTLNECSRTLLEAGAEQVRCLALARGI